VCPPWNRRLPGEYLLGERTGGARLSITADGKHAMALAVANLALVWGGSMPADGPARAESHEDTSNAAPALPASLLRALGGSLRAFRAFLSASRSLAPRSRPAAALGC
jgi:hypothetical protein